VVALQDHLSEAVERALPGLLEAALVQLRAWGHDVTVSRPEARGAAHA
jgi:hypothetical protein